MNIALPAQILPKAKSLRRRQTLHNTPVCRTDHRVGVVLQPTDVTERLEGLVLSNSSLGPQQRRRPDLPPIEPMYMIRIGFGQTATLPNLNPPLPLFDPPILTTRDLRQVHCGKTSSLCRVAPGSHSSLLSKYLEL
jgi:hypothetical protein